MKPEILKYIAVITLFFFFTQNSFGTVQNKMVEPTYEYLTVQELDHRYPGIPKIQVSEARFEQIISNLDSNNGHYVILDTENKDIQLLQQEGYTEYASYIATKTNNRKQRSGYDPEFRDKEALRLLQGGRGGGGGGDGAIVLFFIIGLAVVAVMVFAGLRIVYEELTNPGSYPYMLDIVASYTYFQDSIPASSYNKDDDSEIESSDNIYENGSLTGGKLTIGLINPSTYPTFAFGLAMETGTIDVLLDVETDNGENILLELKGGYGLAGPNIRAYIGETVTGMLSMEVLFGTTNHKKIGVVSLARIGIGIGGDNFHIGFDVGALYINVKESQGYVRNSSDFKYVRGLQYGIQF